MSWQQLVIRSSQSDSEAISSLLFDYGASSVTYLDAEDNPIFEPPPGEMRLWSSVIIRGLFEARENLRPVIEQIQKQLPSAKDYKIEILEDKDWIRAWMDDFSPMPFGKHLWICPSWLQPPQPQAVNIMLDPGIAFGTGTHATTALCLKWLDAFYDKQPLEGLHMVDYGCGSGILSTAALVLGASHVDAVDIDPQAVAATETNAKKNNVSQRLKTWLPKAFMAQEYEQIADILIANILLSPLLDLASLFARLTKAGGYLVLSGILPEQVQQVVNCYQKWFEIQSVVEEDGWARIEAVRLSC